MPKTVPLSERWLPRSVPPAAMAAAGSGSLLPIWESGQSGQVEPTRDFVVTGRERHVAIAREGFLPYPQVPRLRALAFCDRCCRWCWWCRCWCFGVGVGVGVVDVVVVVVGVVGVVVAVGGMDVGVVAVAVVIFLPHPQRSIRTKDFIYIVNFVSVKQLSVSAFGCSSTVLVARFSLPFVC